MAKSSHQAPKNTPKCMSTILYYKGKSGIRMSQKCCHHVRSECIKSYAIKRFVIVWNLILWCVSISVVLCADVSVLHSLCSCVQCVHCECGVVSDCIELMSSLRTVMTVLACVYSVMVILCWRERFSNPFKSFQTWDSAHESNSWLSGNPVGIVSDRILVSEYKPW